MSTASSPASLPVASPQTITGHALQQKSLNPRVVEQCQEIFFRQSMIKDYMSCPHMSLYRWVLNIEESQPFLSAIFGTAGHHVIYKMHSERNYNMGYTEMMELFHEGFNAELDKCKTYPSFSKNFENIQEARDAKTAEYLKYLLGYQFHPRNHSFNSTIHEQPFVLSIPSAASPSNPSGAPYLFTGTIDQAGFYDDGTFSLRDLKFRANNFRPSFTELQLDIQFTIYNAAMAYGNPACNKCRPTYEMDDFQQWSKLVYHGPCEACTALIGTPKWPRKFVELNELIWMLDFEVYSEDKCKTKFIPDNTKPKIPNPSGKGVKVYPKMLNPVWESSPKKGDYHGPGFLRTVRAKSDLDILMSDILHTCDQIRSGIFFRRPGSTCNFWCKYREQCLGGIELEKKEADLAAVRTYGTEDPW